MAGTEVDWEKLLEKRRISIEGEESVLGQRDAQMGVVVPGARDTSGVVEESWMVGAVSGGRGRETQELCSSIWNKIWWVAEANRNK